MAVPTLPNVPYKVQLADRDGYLSQAWAAFFRELFKRIGENIAPSITDLTTVQDQLVVSVGSQGATVASLNSRVSALETTTSGLGVGRAL